MTSLLMLGGWSGAWAQATSGFEVDRPWVVDECLVPMRTDTFAQLNVRRWPRLSLGFSLQYHSLISAEADLSPYVYHFPTA